MKRRLVGFPTRVLRRAVAAAAARRHGCCSKPTGRRTARLGTELLEERRVLAPLVTATLVGTTLDIRIDSADTPVVLAYDVANDSYKVESPGLNGAVSFANAAVTTVTVTGTADAGQEFALGGSSLPDGTGLFDGLLVDGTVETTTLFGAIRTGGGVTVDSSTITLSSTVETITANQSYGGQVTLAGDVVLTGGRVTFGAGVAGQGYGLVLDFTDTTTIDGATFSGIGDFASGGGGTTVLAGTLATTGKQVFADDVELHPSAGLVTLSAVAGTGPGGTTQFADITFLGTVTGSGGLRIVTDGITSFSAPVTLGHFSTDDSGTTRLTTQSFMTTGAQEFYENLEVAADTTLVADSIRLASVVGLGNRLSLAVTQPIALDASMFSGMRALSVTGPVGLGGAFSAIESLSFSSPLALSRLTADTILTAPSISLVGELQASNTLLSCRGETSITGFAYGLSLLQVTGSSVLAGSFSAAEHLYSGVVRLGGRTQFGGGSALFGQGIDGFGNHLTVALATAVVVDNGVFRGVGDFDTAGFTTALLGSFTTAGFQSYGGPVAMSGAVALAASHVEFHGPVTGPEALAIKTSGAVGQTFGTEIHNAVSVGSLEITGSTPTAIFLGGAVETIGTHRYAGDLVTYPSVTTLVGSEVTVTGIVDGRGTILAVAGNAVFGDRAFNLSRLEVSGTTSLAGDVTTTFDQVYGGKVTLTADSVLTGTMGTFPAGVDASGHALGLMFSEPMVLDPKVFSQVGFLTVGGGGTTTLVTDIGTTAGQYYLDELLLQADISLFAGSEGITFAGPVRSTGQDLRTVTVGDTSFGDEVVVRSLDVAVGRAVIGVPAAKGSVTIDSAQSQSFAGDVLVIKPAVLTAGGGFFLGSAVTGPSSLSLRSDQTTTFGGPVSLGSLHTDAGGSTILETGSVTTTDPASMEFGDAVILTQDTVFDAGPGTLSFLSTVDGPFALTAKSSNVTKFAGVVGSREKLASLTTDAGGTVTLGDVATTNAQLFQDDGVSLAGTYTTTDGVFSVAKAATLAAATSVSTGSGAITFGGTVDGAFSLVANSVGATTFVGAVGSKEKLASLTTDAGGTASLRSVATTGAQLYQDDTVTLDGSMTTADAAFTVAKAALLAAATSVSTGSAGISFGGTVDGGFTLVANSSGVTTFAGSVGNKEKVASVTTDAGGTVSLGDVATTGAQLYQDASVSLAGAYSTTDAVFSVTKAAQLAGATSVSTGSGAIAFGGTVDGGFALVANSSGATTFAGAVGSKEKLTSLTTDAGGTASLRSVATTGAQLYEDDSVTLAGSLTTADAAFTVAKAALLAAATSVSTGSAGISFGGTLDGGFALVANSTGATTFAGAVGSKEKLASLTTDAGGTTALPVSVATTVGQTYGDEVLLTANAALASGSGGVSFKNIVRGTDQSLRITTTGDTSVAAAVVFKSLDVAGGRTVLGAVGDDRTITIDSSASQTFAGTVVVNRAAILTAGTGFVFGGAVTGPGRLDLRTSDTTLLRGPVTLGSLHTDAGGSTLLETAVVTTTLNDALDFGDPVVLTRDTTIDAGPGDLIFRSTVDGPHALVARSRQTTRFVGPVGAKVALVSLETDAAGTTAIDGGSVATVKGQFYRDALALGAATVLSAAEAGVTCAATVTGAASLAINAAGTTSFAKAVTVGSLATDAAGTTEIRGGTITTTLPAGQLYRDAVVLGTPTTVAAGAGAIAFLGTVTGKVGLRATTTGSTSFAGPVSVANLETDAGGTVTLANVTTTGFQKYHDDVVTLRGNQATGGGAFAIDRATKLAGATTVSAGAGPITFAGPVDGAFALTAKSAGTTLFGAAVGGVAPLAALVTDAGGTTRIAAPSIKVGAGGIVLADPVQVAVKTSLDAVGGGIRFGAALDGRFPVTVAADRAITFDAPVGAVAPLAGLTLSRGQSVSASAPVRLVGTPAQADGLVVGKGVPNVVLTVPGNSVSGFGSAGVKFLGGSVGSTLDGFTVSGNGTGIRVASGDYSGSAIQGSRIVANKGSGIVLDASGGALQGLRIGGAQPFGTAGTTPTGNRIAGNARHGIENTAGTLTGTTIVSNSIVGNGTGAFGSGLSIAGNGVVVGWNGAADSPARPNVIAGNAAHGIAMSGASVALSNTIHSNGGEPGKGIQLTGAAAAASAAPAIARIVRDNAAAVVRIQVAMTPAAAGHLVQLYSSAVADVYGFPVDVAAFEGRSLLASAKAGADGRVTFELPSATVPVGMWLTATATRLDDAGAALGTSAFSRGVMATAAPVLAVGGDGPTSTWDREVAYTVGDKGTLVAAPLTAGMVASLTSRQGGKLQLAGVPVVLTPESDKPAVIRTVKDIVAKGDGVEITLVPGDTLEQRARGTLVVAAVSLPAARLVDASLLRDSDSAPVGSGAVVGEWFGSRLAAAYDRARIAGETSATAAEIHAFVNRFQGGVRVAAADLDADGYTDIVIAPGAVPGQLVDPATQQADGTGRPLATVFGATARTILLVNGRPGGGAWSTVALDMSSLLDAAPGYAGGFSVAVGDILPEGLPASHAGLPELVVATTGLVDPATRRGADRAWVFDLSVAHSGARPTVDRAEPAADGTRAPRAVRELTLPGGSVTGVTVGAFATDIGQAAAPQGTIVVATTTARPSQLTTSSGVRAMDTAQLTLFGPAARGLPPLATLPIVSPIESGPARTLQNAFIFGASLAAGDVDGDLKTDLVLGASRGGQGAFRVIDNAVVRALVAGGAAPTAAALGAIAEALSKGAQKFGIAGPHGGRPTDNGGDWQPKPGTDFFLGKSVPLPTGAGFNAPLSVAVVERSGRKFTAEVFAALGASNQAAEQIRCYEWQASGSWRAGDALRVADPAAGVVADPDSPNFGPEYLRAGRGLRLG